MKQKQNLITKESTFLHWKNNILKQIEYKFKSYSHYETIR